MKQKLENREKSKRNRLNSDRYKTHEKLYYEFNRFVKCP
jgi:hypothetical protein